MGYPRVLQEATLTVPAPQSPLGAIVSTNLRGRFIEPLVDLLIYSDGILVVRGSYVGVALRAAGAGAGGAGGSWIGQSIAGGIGAGTGQRVGQSYEANRIAQLAEQSRETLYATDKNNFFIAAASVDRVRLQKRWYGARLMVDTRDETPPRSFSWKRARNDYTQVRDLLAATFPDRFAGD